MIRILSNYSWRLCVGFAGAWVLDSTAWAQHRDIFLASRDDGQLAVISAAPVFEVPLASPIVDGKGIAHYPSNNPGYAALNPLFLPDGHSSLPPNSNLSFSILSFPLDGLLSANMWHWDGVDQGNDGDYLTDVAFTPLDTGSTSSFRMYWGPVQTPFLSSGIADGSNVDQPGFVLAQTSSGGGLHVHPGYEVFGPAATPPDEGVYLVSLSLEIENLEDSNPIYLVLRTSEVDPAAGQAAVAWVNNETSVELPTPGDFDFDGDVDGTDFLLWQRGEADDPPSHQGLAAWQANFGLSSSLAAAQPISVPEPTTVSLLIGTIGLLHLVYRRPIASTCTNSV
ncbi:MAG: hypothetical protein AAGD11_01020 [Planctomycetota bacterium]